MDKIALWRSRWCALAPSAFVLARFRLRTCAHRGKGRRPTEVGSHGKLKTSGGAGRDGREQLGIAHHYHRRCKRSIVVREDKSPIRSSTAAELQLAPCIRRLWHPEKALLRAHQCRGRRKAKNIIAMSGFQAVHAGRSHIDTCMYRTEDIVQKTIKPQVVSTCACLLGVVDGEME
ncbi:hypothetical protein IWX91DRAFT_132970 [Phyllosticta citricarpa]